MKKRTLIIVIMLAAALILSTSIGLTVALWTDAGGESGIAPQATVYDWNVLEKYVEIEFVSAGWSYSSSRWNYSGGSPDYSVKIVGIRDWLGGDFVVPKSVTVPVSVGGSNSDHACPVTEVSSSIFRDTTMKALPTSVVIPDNVGTVDRLAFSGLVNLRTVVFAGRASTPGTITVGQYAFSGCTSLRKVEFLAGADSAGGTIATNVSFAADCFLGCDALTEFTYPSGTVIFGGNSYSPANLVSAATWDAFIHEVGATAADTPPSNPNA